MSMPSPKIRLAATGSTIPTKTAIEAMERSTIPSNFITFTVYLDAPLKTEQPLSCCQFLINAQTVQVESSQNHMYGYATNRGLAAACEVVLIAALLSAAKACQRYRSGQPGTVE